MVFPIKQTNKQTACAPCSTQAEGHPPKTLKDVPNFVGRLIKWLSPRKLASALRSRSWARLLIHWSHPLTHKQEVGLFHTLPHSSMSIHPLLVLPRYSPMSRDGFRGMVTAAWPVTGMEIAVHGRAGKSKPVPSRLTAGKKIFPERSTSWKKCGSSKRPWQTRSSNLDSEVPPQICKVHGRRLRPFS